MLMKNVLMCEQPTPERTDLKNNILYIHTSLRPRRFLQQPLLSISKMSDIIASQLGCSVICGTFLPFVQRCTSLSLSLSVSVLLPVWVVYPCFCTAYSTPGEELVFSY